MFSNELEDKDIIQEGCSEFNELYYRYLLCYGFWQIDHQLHKKLSLKSYNITFISYQKQQTLTSVNPYLSQFKGWTQIERSNGNPFSSEVTFPFLSDILIPASLLMNRLVANQDSVRIRACF